jgi:hypothetical protein
MIDRFSKRYFPIGGPFRLTSSTDRGFPRTDKLVQVLKESNRPAFGSCLDSMHLGDLLCPAPMTSYALARRVLCAQEDHGMTPPPPILTIGPSKALSASHTIPCLGANRSEAKQHTSWDTLYPLGCLRLLFGMRSTTSIMSGPIKWPPQGIGEASYCVRGWLATHQGINNGNGPAWRNDFSLSNKSNNRSILQRQRQLPRLHTNEVP